MGKLKAGVAFAMLALAGCPGAVRVEPMAPVLERLADIEVVNEVSDLVEANLDLDARLDAQAQAILDLRNEIRLSVDLDAIANAIVALRADVDQRRAELNIIAERVKKAVGGDDNSRNLDWYTLGLFGLAMVGGPAGYVIMHRSKMARELIDAAKGKSCLLG